MDKQPSSNQRFAQSLRTFSHDMQKRGGGPTLLSMYLAKSQFMPRLDLTPQERDAQLQTIASVAKDFLSPKEMTILTRAISEVRRAPSQKISDASFPELAAPSAQG